MVKSLLDNDLYKFSMSYAYMKLYPEAEGTFAFTNRDKTRKFTPEFLQNLKMEIAKMEGLKLSRKELDWLCSSSISRYIPICYWEWLRDFQFDSSKINVEVTEDGELKLEITDRLYKSTLYEVPLMATISELGNRMDGNSVIQAEMLKKLDDKISLSNQAQLYFSEFGTRRRFSYSVQEDVIERLKNTATYCTGTSNVYLAMKYNMKPIGTQAHEWIMFHGAQYGYRQANYMAMEKWVEVYDGDLGIALTDTYTSQAFFEDFSKKHAKLWDGVRHDSGDPYKYVMMTLERYQDLGIDSTSKTIVFSNALTMPEYQRIAEYCRGRIRCAAGIGTNLTNDTGNKPFNMVIKLVQCRMTPRERWFPCVKISDDLGKHMGDENQLHRIAEDLGLDKEKLGLKN